MDYLHELETKVKENYNNIKSFQDFKNLIGEEGMEAIIASVKDEINEELIKIYTEENYITNFLRVGVTNNLRFGEIEEAYRYMTIIYALYKSEI